MRTVRSLVVGVLLTAFGSTAWAATCDGFTDVDAGASYCTAVVYLKDHGITLGCTGTTYCPSDFVTRAQMALFLQRMGQADPSNTLGDHTSAIGGGIVNAATGAYSVISGGYSNQATNFYSVVLGGYQNIASASASIAAGVNAKADQRECAVLALWGDDGGLSCLGQPNIFKMAGDHGFSIDYHARVGANGGGDRWVAIGDTVSMQTIATWTGASLTDAGVWVDASSSKATKTEFADVNAKDILDKVAKMPITTWRYKQGEGEVRHIGPMAEDFWESFGVGYGPQTIADLDARGVALAAIQGLNAKLEGVVAEQSRELATQAHELAEIKAQLAAMGVH